MREHFAFVLFLLVPCVLGGVLLFLYRRHRAGDKKLRIGSLIAGNLLVLAFLLSLAFVAGETYYRFIYDETDSIDYTRVSRRWFSRYWVQNSIGFRDNIEYTREIEPGKRRVTFLGDSFTAGHGIKSVEDRFPNILRAAHPEWEVHVLAGLGLDTGPELNLISGALADGYQVDLVVLVYCLNDVSDLDPQWRDIAVKMYEGNLRPGWLRRHSYLADILHYRLAAARNPYLKDYFAYVSEGYHGAIWESQKKRLAKLRQIVEHAGGRFAVVTFPFLNALGPNYRFQLAHDQLNRFWADQNVPHLDLLSVYSNLPPSKLVVNRFDAHPNEYANALAARAIDSFLKPLLSTRPVAHGKP